MEKKLSKTFITLMRGKSINVYSEQHSNALIYENKYIKIEFSYNDEYNALRVRILERSIENDVAYFENYAEAMSKANEVIKYARMIFDIEDMVLADKNTSQYKE